MKLSFSTFVSSALALASALQHRHGSTLRESAPNSINGNVIGLWNKNGGGPKGLRILGAGMSTGRMMDATDSFGSEWSDQDDGVLENESGERTSDQDNSEVIPADEIGIENESGEEDGEVLFPILNQCVRDSGFLPDGFCRTIFDVVDVVALVDDIDVFEGLIHTVAGNSRFLLSLFSPTSGNQGIADIVNLFEEGYDIFGQHSIPSFCFGDFDGREILNEPTFNDQSCAHLPLKDDVEYSILSFSFPVICLGDIVPQPVTFCLATSVCEETGVPSVVFGVNGQLLHCLTGNPLAELAQRVVYGYSLHNAMQMDFPIYGGELGVIEHTSNPSLYGSGTIGIAATSLNLPDIFSISGTVEAGLTFLLKDEGKLIPAGVDQVDDIEGLATFAANYLQGLPSALTYQQAITGSIEIRLSPSNLPKGVGKFLPALSIDLFDSSSFMSSGPSNITLADNSVVPINRGYYMYASTSFAADAIQALFDYVMNIAGGVLDIANNFLPDCITSDDLIQFVDISSIVESSNEDDFGAGITINEKQIGVMFSLPFLIDEIGSLSINCYANYDLDDSGEGSFRCDVDFSFGLFRAFEAVAHEIEDGILWVAHEVGDHLVELGEVIGVALDDGLDEFSSVFDKNNLKRTAEMIGDGILDVAGLVDADDIEKYAEKALSILKDPAEDIANAAVGFAHDVAETALDLIDDAERLYEDARKAFHDASNAVENALGCAQGAAESLLLGNGGNDDCGVFETINDAINDAVGGVEDVIDDIGDFASDLWNDFTDGIGGIWNRRELLFGGSISIPIPGIPSIPCLVACDGGISDALQQAFGCFTNNEDTFKECASARTYLVEAARQAFAVMEAFKEHFDNVKRFAQAALRATALTGLQLLGAGLTCFNTLCRGGGVVDLLTTCIGIPQLSLDGTLSAAPSTSMMIQRAAPLVDGASAPTALQEEIARELQNVLLPFDLSMLGSSSTPPPSEPVTRPPPIPRPQSPGRPQRPQPRAAVHSSSTMAAP